MSVVKDDQYNCGWCAFRLCSTCILPKILAASVSKQNTAQEEK